MDKGRIALALAALELGIAGLIYFFAPATMMKWNGMALAGAADTHTIRAAYGGGFLGMASLFAAGFALPDLRRPALIAAIAFMGGFATGRIWSFVVDGWSAPAFPIILFTELLVAGLALAALRTQRA